MYVWALSACCSQRRSLPPLHSREFFLSLVGGRLGYDSSASVYALSLACNAKATLVLYCGDLFLVSE